MTEEPAIDTAEVRAAEVARVRAAALADDMTLPALARLTIQARHLLAEPCTARLGGETTLGELLDERAENLAKSPRRTS